jgi:predicted O-methyltransferase YrrM
MKPQIRTLLSKLEKNAHLFWNIPPETGLFLNQIVRLSKPLNILEIGTSNGYSAIWLAEALSHNTTSKQKSQLYTIESNKKLRFPKAQKNIAKAGLQNQITQILGHAPEAIPKKPHKFDLIFIDATKYEHIDYLKAILPRTHKGSIIVTDNALSHKKELKPYLKKVAKLKNFETHLLKIGTGLLISTRTS